MTNEERMRHALICIGNNLQGPGRFDYRPLSYEFALKLAELAFAVANGEPHEKFDAGIDGTPVHASRER